MLYKGGNPRQRRWISLTFYLENSMIVMEKEKGC